MIVESLRIVGDTRFFGRTYSLRERRYFMIGAKDSKSFTRRLLLLFFSVQVRTFHRSGKMQDFDMRMSGAG